MATFNIASAKNIDELASKAGSDTYNILNGGYLTVDQDTRYGTNGATVAAMGNITMAAGGACTVEFTATKVRLIPYDTGTGNVPASNTAITRGSSTGKLIGVYANLTSAPTAAAAAMPASGYIKIKQWNDVAYTAGALGGIGANATGVDVAGWIEIVGVDALDATVNRLNTFKVRGEWYEIGTTDGNRATTYQIPNNGSAVVHLAGVWVETAASSGVYEFYPCANPSSALLANIGTEATRGKFCWISAAGVLRFGNDGTNSTGGYIPATGLKVRIPNIFFFTCASAATVNNLPNATLTTRFSFVTTGGGVIDIDKCMMNWWPAFNQPYSVSLTNVGILTQLLVTEIASPIAWSQVGIGQETPANGQFGLSMATCFAGGTMDKCTWTSATLGASGRYVTSLTDISGFTITNERVCAMAARGNATTGASIQTRVTNSTWTDTLVGLGRIFMTTNADVTYTRTAYYDCVASTTPTGNPMNIFDLGTKCSNIKIDTVTFPIALTQPYAGILNVGATACSGIKLRNLGTYAAPLDMGGPQKEAIAWSRATTTATITSTAHGLKTGDIIYCLVSSDVAAIVVGTKTLASAADANTFTFACLNAGAASGTLTYYPTMTGLLFAVASAANNVEIKRCYAPHLRTNLYTSDNSVKNLVMKNVMGDYINAPLATAGPALDLIYQGIHATPAQTAQVSDYGTIWFDGFIQETTSPAAGRSYTRSTTTATVTNGTDHNLRTGMQIIVTVTDSAAAIVLGVKTVTVLTKDTFTFTCLNGGAASGVITYVPITGRIGLMMNEKTAATAAHYTTTGTPSFTSAGTLFWTTAGDKVVWETPDYIIGHTGFPILEPVLNLTTSAKRNLNVLYYIDKNDGAGYGAAKNLSYIRAGGGGSNGSTNITMTDTTGVAVNDYIFGTNVAPLAKVQSITNGTTIVSTIANVGAVSGVLLFNQLPNETVDAQKGFKLKISMEAKKGTAAATWTRSTTTATCTYTDHGLSVGDVFAVTISSDEAAITVAAKTVAAVTNENVFTFTCLNAGGASGTLTYTYPVLTSYHIVTDSSEVSRAYQYVLDPVTLTQTVKDSAGTAIAGARVLLLADAGGSLPAQAAVTITSSGAVATVAHTAHGMVVGQLVQIKGANQQEYNGIRTITGVATDSYTYAITGTPASPATGTIKATAVVLTGVTDASGNLTGTFAYSGAAQPITGRARKSTAPYYQTNQIVGSITSAGYTGTVFLVADA